MSHLRTNESFFSHRSGLFSSWLFLSVSVSRDLGMALGEMRSLDLILACRDVAPRSPAAAAAAAAAEGPAPPLPPPSRANPTTGGDLRGLTSRVPAARGGGGGGGGGARGSGD